jgi:very-short-patch-repair endonuclease
MGHWSDGGGQDRSIGAVQGLSSSARDHRAPSALAASAAPAESIRHPLTSPILTLVDIATRLDRGSLEAAISEADKRGLADPETIRSNPEEFSGWPGARVLRQTLDRRTFALTDSELERRFLPLARAADLPLPETGTHLNGFKVDFYWPELELVVETDGLRYHRTPAQQAKDRIRDQALVAAGLTPLRFTHAQVRFEPGYVRATLAAVARQLVERSRHSPDP